MCALGCCLTAYTAKTMLLVQLLQSIFGKSTAHSQNALSTDRFVKPKSACSWYDHVWYSFPAKMTDAWYSRCHTIQVTDHVIMYNVVDAIVLVAQPLQYQFDTAGYGTPIGEIMYVHMVQQLAHLFRYSHQASTVQVYMCFANNHEANIRGGVKTVHVVFKYLSRGPRWGRAECRLPSQHHPVS
jgi:hypothetical protein